MEEILFANPTDQRVFDSSYKGSSNPRQAYRRAYEAQSRRFKAEDQREANTVQVESRSSSRFMGAGEAGIPISKHRLSESIRLETEQKGRELYQNIQIYRKAGIPVNHLNAELGSLLGYTVATIHDYEVYFNSPEIAARFGIPAE
jgi:hypothetical protein